MRRGDVLKLREVVWITPLKGDPLEVALRPSDAAAAFGDFGGNVEPVTKARRVCTSAFVDFRNYLENDGKTPVANTLDTRMELYLVPIIGRLIDSELFERSSEVARGEDAPPEAGEVRDTDPQPAGG